MPTPFEPPRNTRKRGLFAVKRTDHHPKMLPLIDTLREATRIEEIWTSPGHLPTKEMVPTDPPAATIQFLLSYSELEKDMDKLLLYITSLSAKPVLPFRIQAAKHFVPWETLSLYTLSIRPVNIQNEPVTLQKIIDDGIRHVHRLLQMAMKPGVLKTFLKKEVNARRSKHRQTGKIMLPDLNDFAE